MVKYGVWLDRKYKLASLISRFNASYSDDSSLMATPHAYRDQRPSHSTSTLITPAVLYRETTAQHIAAVDSHCPFAFFDSEGGLNLLSA